MIRTVPPYTFDKYDDLQRLEQELKSGTVALSPSGWVIAQSATASLPHPHQDRAGAEVVVVRGWQIKMEIPAKGFSWLISATPLMGGRGQPAYIQLMATKQRPKTHRLRSNLEAELIRLETHLRAVSIRPGHLTGKPPTCAPRLFRVK